MAINGCDYHCLTSNEDEVVQTLGDFKIIESRTMIILDNGNEESLYKYIREFQLCHPLLLLI